MLFGHVAALPAQGVVAVVIRAYPEGLILRYSVAGGARPQREVLCALILRLTVFIEILLQG